MKEDTDLQDLRDREEYRVLKDQELLVTKDHKVYKDNRVITGLLDSKDHKEVEELKVGPEVMDHKVTEDHKDLKEQEVFKVIL